MALQGAGTPFKTLIESPEASRGMVRTGGAHSYTLAVPTGVACPGGTPHRTVVPRPGADSISNVPPSRSTRSRIPARPK